MRYANGGTIAWLLVAAACGSSHGEASSDAGRSRIIVTLASGQNHPGSIAVDARGVYWIDVGQAYASNGAIVSAPLDGGEPVTIASGRRNPAGLALDGANVYWTDRFVPGSVMRAPLDGGPPVTLASGLDNPTAIAVGGGTLYWTASDIPGAVLALPLVDGGTVVTLAPNESLPTALALEGATATRRPAIAMPRGSWPCRSMGPPRPPSLRRRTGRQVSPSTRTGSTGPTLTRAS